MAQPPQAHMPPRAFSPPQNSPSPGNSNPPLKMQKPHPQSVLSPRPQSQPGSPFPPSPYPLSPGAVTPAATTPSPSQPAYSYIAPAVQAQSPLPYPNGTPAPTPNIQNRPTYVPLGAANPGPASGPQTPSTPGIPHQTYTTASFATNPAPPMPGTGAMAPPAKPATKDYEYEVTDSLLGTGVNIREEENNLAEYYAGTFAQDSRTGLPANAPGNAASFYGAGVANQPGQPDKVNQKEAEAAAAERAWKESAARLSAQRAQEHNNPFLQLPNVHYRAQKIAKEYGIELNLDQKNQHLQKSRNPAEYEKLPRVEVKTTVGPDGAMMSVYGSVLPPDSYLIDQLALLSIATKQRFREMIVESDRLATHRQQTTHGVIPTEWADVAVPMHSSDAGHANEASPQAGVESAASPRANPLKRSFDASNGHHSVTPGRHGAPPVNRMTQVMREMARTEREAEEARLKKRQKRLHVEAAGSASRSGSVAPGTPGSVAPEVEKAPTRKELKKAATARAEAASSAANVNKTTMQFLGGGKKKYSWMTGGSASGTSTPSRLQTQGLPGTPGGTPAGKGPENTALTQDSRHKLGMWREYGEKGKNIQLRDWVLVLERDGRDSMALQKAYLKLDVSEPK